MFNHGGKAPRDIALETKLANERKVKKEILDNRIDLAVYISSVEQRRNELLDRAVQARERGDDTSLSDAMNLIRIAESERRTANAMLQNLINLESWYQLNGLIKDFTGNVKKVNGLLHGRSGMGIRRLRKEYDRAMRDVSRVCKQVTLFNDGKADASEMIDDMGIPDSEIMKMIDERSGVKPVPRSEEPSHSNEDVSARLERLRDQLGK